jgi:hypothetical protein
LLVSQSTITRFKQNKNTLQLETEDLSEVLLSKELPEFAEDLSYAKSDRLKPIPMVYGHVDKSPVLKKVDLFKSDAQGNQVVQTLQIDKYAVDSLYLTKYEDNYPTTIRDWYINSSIYIHDKEYLNLINNVPHEYENVIDIDSTLPFFELSGREIVITQAYYNFATQLKENKAFSDYAITNPALARILRVFNNVTGQKAHARFYSPHMRTTQQHLYASTDYNNNEDPFSGNFEIFGKFHSDMYGEDNEFNQFEAHFPFDTDRYENWNIDNYDQKNTTEFTEAELLESWNVHNNGETSMFTAEPRNYLSYIKNNDDRCLAWSGFSPSNEGDQGSFVNWDFILDERGLSNQCITWFVGEIKHWKNPNISYGDTADTTDTFFIGGSAIWSNSVDVPILQPISHEDLFESISSSDDINDQGQTESWDNWNTIAPATGTSFAGRLDFVNDNSIKHIFEGVLVPEWNTVGQLKSVRIGQPRLYEEFLDITDGYYTTFGALNYMHFLQDVFIEEIDRKDWYANVKGRITYQVLPVPFNSFDAELMPSWNGDTATNAIEDYLESIGYSKNFTDETQDSSGGVNGWIINATPNELNLEFIDSLDIDITSDYILVYTQSGNFNIKYEGNWIFGTSLQPNIQPFEAFVVLSWKEPLRITYKGYSFMRMNHINGTDNDWEQNFTPQDTEDIITNYENSGYDFNLYIPEITRLVESPPLVLIDIMQKETNFFNFVYSKTEEAIIQHQGWRLGFTINERQTTKELIQDISSNTKLFPKFTSDGTFSYTTIKDTYNYEDVDYVIKKYDIISHTFDVTKIEDVKSKYGVLYKYDYAEEDYEEIVSSKSIVTQFQVFSDYKEITENLYDQETPERLYSISKYNKTDDESTREFEAKYIRKIYTAEKLRKYLLMENINQHLLINITVNNKYINAEIGDIIYLEKIEDKLGLGYKYWAYEVINGQMLYPFYIITEINKINNKINIKLRRLHRLQYGMPEFLIAEQNANTNYVLPDNIDDIKEVYDKPRIYTKNNVDVTAYYEPLSDDEEIPVNEEFSLEWTPNDSSNVLLGTGTSTIRLNVMQSEDFGFETEEWTYSLYEDGRQYADTSPSFTTTSYIDPNNNYNGFVLVNNLSDNDTDEVKHGAITIRSSTGKTFTRPFLQLRSTDDEDETVGMPDINGDGVGNVLDLIATMQYILGEITFTQEQIELADVTGDGGVNVLDIGTMINIILDN